MRLLSFAPPAFIAAVALGLGVGSWTVGLTLVGLTLACALFGGHVALGRWGQMFWTLVATGAGFALGITVIASFGDAIRPNLGPLAVGIAMAALVAGWLRMLLREPLFGHRATLALHVVALAASGASHAGLTYRLLVAAFMLTATVALQPRGWEGFAWAHLDRKRQLGWAVAIVVAVLVAYASGRTVPTLYRQGLARLAAFAEGALETGVGSKLGLASSVDMSESDTIVLRLRGPRVDYLRGLVFDTYRQNHWEPRQSMPWPLTVPTSAPSSHELTVIYPAKADNRYYLPRGAQVVAASEGTLMLDSDGLARAPSDAYAGTVWLEPVTHRVSSKPAIKDTAVPERLQRRLRQYLQRIVGSNTEPRRVLQSIEQHLRSHFHYSLRHSHQLDTDPLVAFLFDDKTGHCEEFASAMTLLARTAGIPARVVTGYRVTEYNQLGGYYVVRAHNAHAWVEAYVPSQGWVEFDPTPAADQPLDSTNSLWRQLYDLARGGWRLRSAQDPAKQFFWVGAVAACVPALLLLRRVRRAHALRQQQAQHAPATAMDRLLACLSLLGYHRPAHEPLESFARRLQCTPPSWAPKAARLIEDYARYRYGKAPLTASAIEGDVRSLTDLLQQQQRAEPSSVASASVPSSRN